MRRTTSAADVSDIGESCEHCGAPLEPVVVERPAWMAREGRSEPMVIGYRQCGCDGAVAAREAARRREVEQEAALRKRRRLDALRDAGIRPRYVNARHARAGEVVEACRHRRNVYVHGDTGTWKTTLASAAAIAMVDSPTFRRVLFATSVEVLTAIKATFGGRAAGDPLAKYKRASVLLLDDLGKEAPSDWAVEKLFDLVNARYNDLLPTVVTTQYDPERLIERLSERGGEENAVAIVSRLRSKVDGAVLIRLEGADRRLG